MLDYMISRLRLIRFCMFNYLVLLLKIYEMFYVKKLNGSYSCFGRFFSFYIRCLFYAI